MVAVLTSTLFAAVAQAQPEVVAPGVTLVTEDSTHVLEIEIDHPDVTIEVSEPEMRGERLSEYAQSRGVAAAVNGGPFEVEGFTPRGLTIGSGRKWAGTADDGEHALMALDVDGCGGIYPAATWKARERWMYHAVGGGALIVVNGTAAAGVCDGDECLRAQSAVGLSRDGRRMLLLATDLATPEEVGELLAQHGAWAAMLLDGGASSAMYVQGRGIVNALSDGVERPVASHIGVFSPSPPRFWDVRGVTQSPEVEVELRTFWDQHIETRSSAANNVFQFMPVPFRNVRILSEGQCLFTGFTGPEDVRLWWSIPEISTCPPVECTRVDEALAATEPRCPDKRQASARTDPKSAAGWSWPLCALGVVVVGWASLRRRA